MVVAAPGATSAGRSRCPARAQALNPVAESNGLAPYERGVHSNTSVAACFAARSRSVLWQTLGAIYSNGCRCAFVATESRFVHETDPDRPRPVSALTPTVG